jgi:hypothetical protein
MLEDMDDIEKLTWIELRHGLTKSIGTNPSNDKVEEVEKELLSILNKHREEKKIVSPIPRVRMWITNDRVNFMFYDRKNGKRVILGEWLSNKEPQYER